MTQSASDSPIGVMDSGAGGLSVLRELTAQLPSEHLLYVADSANAPYGSRDKDFVLDRCRKILNFFVDQQVKAVVLACNTATAAAVAELRLEYQFPIVGMEPALKPAAALTQSGVVGVLATEGTIESDKFLNLKSRFSDQVEFITVACHGLVDAIEKQDKELRQVLLHKYIGAILEKKADTLILGCTHYPLIKQEVLQVSQNLGAVHIKLIDTGEAVAKELQRKLKESELLLASKKRGQISFYNSEVSEAQILLLNEYWADKALMKLLPA